MPTYKFKYFNARGFGEVPRLLFALAGKDYEDIRFTQETWPEEKPKTPFGQMPILEVDGKCICQSTAIARYLAREFGYYGKSNMESTQIDQVLGIMQDVINALIKAYYEKDETRKAQFMQENKDEKIPQYLGMLEKILKDNGSTGYFVGNSITLADIYVFDFVEKIKDMVDFDKFKLVKKSVDMIGANEKIKAWVAKRPVTEN